MALKPVSVTQLNTYIKRILSADPILNNIGVCGELSNLTRHSSGHWYFSLKDENSRVNCFLPASRVASLRFALDEGMQITVYGSLSVYERGGSYSLQVRDVQAEGEGTLKQAYDLLKRKLEAEGLFDPARKRPLPANPRRIGVVTSPTGAAIHDIISTVGRRNPGVDILIYPALVQGEGSAASVCEGIRCMNEKFPDLDLLIVGRGGGSAEDLWTFNEESVARAVSSSAIPVISAVGHEVDYVITDFAADLRGATPTAAAELAVPDLSYVKNRLQLYAPDRMIAMVENRIREAEYKLNMLRLALDSADPRSVLNKGYALVRNSSGDILDFSSVQPGELVCIEFAGGTIKAEIVEKDHEEE